MKKLIIIAIVFGLFFAFNPSFSKKEAKPKASKPTVGTVVCLTELAKGTDGKLTKDEAVKKADEGNPMVLLVGTGKSAKVYFIFNTDGSFAGKKLAKMIKATKVGVTGKVKTINGINIIIADIINPMD